MGYPVYYVEAGDTLPILFDSFDGGTGASITLTGLATTDIEIYKDGSATQRASDNGYALLDTDGIDFDGITGIHGFSIDLSDNSDAGFYAVGSWYHVVVSSVTIDAQTVSFIAAAFRIVSATRGMAGTALPDAAADAAGGLPISDAGGLDLDAMNTNVNDIETDTNELQTDWVNGGRLDLLIDAILADTNELQTDDVPGLIAALNNLSAAAAADAVWDEALAGHLGVGSTGEALNAAGAAGDPWTTALPGAYGAGSAGYIVGNNLDASVADVEADTQDIQSRLPAALVSGRMSSDAVAVSGSTAAADAVEANIGNLDAAISGLNDLSAADVNAEVDTALSDINLDHLLKTPVSDTSQLGSGGGNEVVDGTIMGAVLSTGGDPDNYNLATDSLQSIRDHQTVIETDTNELQTDWTNGGRLDLIIDAILADTNEMQTDNIPGLIAALNNLSAAAAADAVWDEAKAGHVGAGSFGEEVQAHALTSEVSAVETDTQDIQNRLPAALVGGRMDSSVGAMAAAVITAAAIATGAIDADALAADFTDEIWDEAVGDGAYTIRQVLRIALAVLAGKSDGGGTVTHHYRDTADSKNVVTATVGALTGDRSAVTLNP